MSLFFALVWLVGGELWPGGVVLLVWSGLGAVWLVFRLRGPLIALAAGPVVVAVFWCVLLMAGCDGFQARGWRVSGALLVWGGLAWGAGLSVVVWAAPRLGRDKATAGVQLGKRLFHQRLLASAALLSLALGGTRTVCQLAFLAGCALDFPLAPWYLGLIDRGLSDPELSRRAVVAVLCLGLAAGSVLHVALGWGIQRLAGRRAAGEGAAVRSG
ncbi:MAG TPA: hypothetical protein EYH34_12560 [Planctomycetes bacterium]|nr:hypothetical protein [Planctomycetota bacterium]